MIVGDGEEVYTGGRKMIFIEDSGVFTKSWLIIGGMDILISTI